MSGAQYPAISSASVDARSIDVPWLVVPVFSADEVSAHPHFARLDAACGGVIEQALATGEFRGKRGESLICAPHGDEWSAGRLLLVGADGTDESVTSRLRQAAAVGARAARVRRIPRMAVWCRGDGTAGELVSAVVEGVGFGGFVDRRFKRNGDDDAGPPSCELVWAEAPPPEARELVDRGNAVARGVSVARELANEPANALTPSVFANRAHALVDGHGVRAEVLDEAAIERLGMGMLLGVARGSVEPPRLLVMRHDPSGAPESPMLGLIGKGVTFDSGGISIKPADGMERMRSDMSGGAAVVGAMSAIGALGAPHRVLGIVPMTENMPSGTATKPGDVLTSAEGTTVEVINTDAEGRLILGDALWYARAQGATHLVDVATLTGACVVALGRAASGLFARPRGWGDTVQAAAEQAGERVWPLPLYADYREQLKSETADLANTGGRPAGACTAASFLEAFAGDTPWAHVDIAGTAWVEEGRDDRAPGATGVMVRTLVDLAVSERSW